MKQFLLIAIALLAVSCGAPPRNAAGEAGNPDPFARMRVPGNAVTDAREAHAAGRDAIYVVSGSGQPVRMDVVPGFSMEQMAEDAVPDDMKTTSVDLDEAAASERERKVLLKYFAAYNREAVRLVRPPGH